MGAGVADRAELFTSFRNLIARLLYLMTPISLFTFAFDISLHY